ncbi:MAG: nucleotidyltransferase family protein [Bacteroidota bacterium]
MKINHALIMAAGRGQRMMPLTNEIPKAMAVVDGITLISKGIDNIRRHLDNLFITVGYKGAMLAGHVIEHNVTAVFNTEGKGNAWWIFNTLLKHVDEPVFVLTCDNIIELDFDSLSKDYFAQGAPACMIVSVTPVPGLEGDYILTDEENHILELNRNKQTDIYCSGIQIINPYKVNQLAENCEDFYEVWSTLMAEKEMKCSNIQPSKWISIDTLEQLNKANEKM